MPYAVDPEAAERLWSLSEQLLGLEPALRNKPVSRDSHFEIIVNNN
jgi:hypothetical protein